MRGRRLKWWKKIKKKTKRVWKKGKNVWQKGKKVYEKVKPVVQWINAVRDAKANENRYGRDAKANENRWRRLRHHHQRNLYSGDWEYEQNEQLRKRIERSQQLNTQQNKWRPIANLINDYGWR